MDWLTPLLVIALASALLLALRSVFGSGRREADALRRHAQQHGRRFLSASEGGPAVCFDVDGYEGEARFRSGKRRFRLDNHVRVLLDLGAAEGVHLRIVPPMMRHGDHMKMLHPVPDSSQGWLPEHLFDVHATPDELLTAVLADGTAAFMVRRHPRVWVELKNGRVEVRLAGETGDRLIVEAIDLAVGIHARVRKLLNVAPAPLNPQRHGRRRNKHRNARIGALVFVAAAGAALASSISFGWFGQERRDMTTFVYERRGPLCGFVRNLPVVQDYVTGVPCQVWNLMPLTGLGAIAAGWLLLDLTRSVANGFRRHED